MTVQCINVKSTDIRFRIRASRIASATEAYRKLVTEKRILVAGINKRLGMQGHEVWPLPGSYKDSLRSVFESYGFSTSIDKKGGLRLTGFTGAMTEGVLDLLRSVVGFAGRRSHIDFTSDNGLTCKVIQGRHALRIIESKNGNGRSNNATPGN